MFPQTCVLHIFLIFDHFYELEFDEVIETVLSLIKDFIFKFDILLEEPSQISSIRNPNLVGT